MLLAPFGLIGLPVGIWTLLVLSDEDIRAAFGRIDRHPFASGRVLAWSAAVAVLPLIVVLLTNAIRSRQSLNAVAEAERRERKLAAMAEPTSLAAKVAPVVVKTVPESGASGVDPALSEIQVTFSKSMRRHSWGWAKENSPAISGNAHYLSDGRTCVLPVRLEPGKVYAIWINSEQSSKFSDTTGNPALPYLLIFETRK
jgi:RNA polymerase sigma-70 factor (ECF subfamily)